MMDVACYVLFFKFVFFFCVKMFDGFFLLIILIIYFFNFKYVIKFFIFFSLIYLAMAACKFHWKLAQRAIGGGYKLFHTSLADAPRRADFSALTSRDLQFFQGVLGSNGMRTEELDDFNVDFMRWYKGNAACVLFPSNAEQVSPLLAYCHSRKLAVVPQAGNTGLVGGSVPVYDEIVLSTRRIANKFAFDASSGIVQCDSGFVLEEVDNRLAADGYMVPVDLGAKGSCLMGGIVATNAGGIRLIRYGSMHANVTGLEVVLADKEGSRLQLGSNLRKDNTELHLHKLFIGSEGQLGIITGVSMQVVPKPVSILSAFLGVNSFEKCRQLLHLGKQMLNEILSSFELIDTDTMELVEKKTALASPLGSKSNFYLLVETSGSDAESDAVKMDRFLSHALESGLAENGVLANSRAEADHLWKIRENCPLASRDDGYCFKHDMSLPLQHFYELTEVVKERLNGKAKNIVTFGHMGDGNTHLNVTTPEFDQEVHDLLYPFIYEWVASKNGSISAEHGIGRLKRLYHHKLVDPKRQQISRELKKMFDPNGILSPYKMID